MTRDKAPEKDGKAESFGTRPAFLIPLAVDLLLAFTLLVLTFSSDGMSLETVVLLVIFVVLFAMLVFSSRRKATIEPSGIVVRGLLGAKKLGWEDIANVDALVLNKRVYLLFTTTRGFYTLSNNLSDFSTIVSRVIDYAGEDKIEPAARKALENVPQRVSDIVLLWTAACVMIGMLCFNLLS